MEGRRSVRVASIALLGLGVLALAPDGASAHDVTGSRFDAPLPLSLLLAGAGGTVALTALWIAFTGRTTTTTEGRTLATIDARTVRWLRSTGRVLFFLGVLTSLAFGYGVARAEYVGLFVLAYATPLALVATGSHPLVALPLLTAPIAVRLARTLLTETSGQALNPALEDTGKLLAAYAVLFGVGLALPAVV